MRVSVPLSDHIYWGESKNGARRRIRTADTAIFNRLLYQLSYPGTANCGVFRPMEACL